MLDSESGRSGWHVERRTRLLIRHFQEEQKRQLLNAVGIREAMLPKDQRIIPELLHELWCWVRHDYESAREIR
jgi:hypothetical protein